MKKKEDELEVNKLYLISNSQRNVSKIKVVEKTKFCYNIQPINSNGWNGDGWILIDNWHNHFTVVEDYPS